jgi:hypothetical protein
MTTIASSQDLHAKLMAPEAMKRVLALHAVEVEADKATATAVVKAFNDFAARGIPFYSPQDPHYQEWVGKAVGYWEQLHGGAKAPRRAAAKRHA